MNSRLLIPSIVIVVGTVALIALAAVGISTGDDGEAAPPAVQDPDGGDQLVWNADFNAEFGTPGYRFDDPDVEIELVADVHEWEVLDGETIEIWAYNGQYPGPEIRVTEGQKVRVTLRNELPEATSIHWHGLDVPNPEDGVPGITQPVVEPGETWTYEFIAERVGTTVYHTHASTLTQLPRGLFGMLIVEPADGDLLPRHDYDIDREFTIALHETQGYYTINGHSFPKTLEEDLLTIRTGERVLIRFANMGSEHHPMHLHGHQFEIVSIDGNEMEPGWFQNTVDIPPGATVDVVVHGNNPGTWVFHCHIIPHVANQGQYPGGMLMVLDYEDHDSFFEVPPPGNGDDEPVETPTPVPTEEPEPSADLVITAENNLFDADTLVAPANTEVTLLFDNRDAVAPHNWSLYEDDSAANALYEGEIFTGPAQRTITFTTPDPGTYFYRCDVHPATMIGDLVVQ